MSKLNQTQKLYIRRIKLDKKDDCLNTNIAKTLAEKIQLNLDSYTKIYVDDQNHLVFSKLEI
jgi:hypothetical protein